MTEQSPEQPTDEQTQSPIGDEAAFCRTIGIDPDHVKAGSINVEFLQGQPILTFTSIYAVPPRALGLAFLAASPHEEAPPQPKQPTDRARKAPVKKAASRTRKATS